MRRFGAGVVLLAGLTAIPAFAQTAPRTASFRSGGVIFSLPLPDGYCEPSGKAIDVAQVVAATDSDNATLLTLFPCGDAGSAANYYIVKAPKTALFTAVTRARMLAEVSAAFDNPANQDAIDPQTVNTKAAQGFSETLHQEVDVDTAIHPAGHDETCVYVAGTAAIKTGSVSYSRSVSACITTVSDRILFVYRFGDGATPGNARGLLPSAKAMALSIVGKPAE